MHGGGLVSYDEARNPTFADFKFDWGLSHHREKRLYCSGEMLWGGVCYIASVWWDVLLFFHMSGWWFTVNSLALTEKWCSKVGLSSVFHTWKGVPVFWFRHIFATISTIRTRFLEYPCTSWMKGDKIATSRYVEGRSAFFGCLVSEAYVHILTYVTHIYRFDTRPSYGFSLSGVPGLTKVLPHWNDAIFDDVGSYLSELNSRKKNTWICVDLKLDLFEYVENIVFSECQKRHLVVPYGIFQRCVQHYES